MIAIKTCNLTKRYKDILAVDNLNLEIISGELFSLLGVNGAGKSIKSRPRLEPWRGLSIAKIL